MKEINSTIILIIVAALWLASIPATAASVRPMPLEQLAERSEQIMLGEVLSVQALWDASNERIWTTVNMHVERQFKGTIPGLQTVSFVVPGGELGQIGQVVAGAPTFVPGERALVLLERREPEGKLAVAGFNQGKLVPFGCPADGQTYWARADSPYHKLINAPEPRQAAAELGVEIYTIEELTELFLRSWR